MIEPRPAEPDCVDADGVERGGTGSAGAGSGQDGEAERILAFVNETLNAHAEPVTDPGTNLIEAGILDSIGMLELVVFLESSFGVRVANEDLSAAHFADARSIARYVAAARNGS